MKSETQLGYIVQLRTRARDTAAVKLAAEIDRLMKVTSQRRHTENMVRATECSLDEINDGLCLIGQSDQPLNARSVLMQKDDQQLLIGKLAIIHQSLGKIRQTEEQTQAEVMMAQQDFQRAMKELKVIVQFQSRQTAHITRQNQKRQGKLWNEIGASLHIRSETHEQCP